MSSGRNRAGVLHGCVHHCRSSLRCIKTEAYKPQIKYSLTLLTGSVYLYSTQTPYLSLFYLEPSVSNCSSFKRNASLLWGCEKSVKLLADLRVVRFEVN